MKSADIERGAYYAASIPRNPGRSRADRSIMRVRVEDFTSSPPRAQVHLDVDTAYPALSPWERSNLGTERTIPNGGLIAPWDTYVVEAAHAAALAMDRRRDDMAAYERRRAAKVARIEGWLPAFEGIMVPADALSTANYGRPDVDLGAELRRTFVEGNASGAMFGTEVFERIAARIEDGAR